MRQKLHWLEFPAKVFFSSWNLSGCTCMHRLAPPPAPRATFRLVCVLVWVICALLELGLWSCHSPGLWCWDLELLLYRVQPCGILFQPICMTMPCVWQLKYMNLWKSNSTTANFQGEKYRLLLDALYVKKSRPTNMFIVSSRCSPNIALELY